MKYKIYTLIVVTFFCTSGLYAQKYNFAWFTDTHVGGATGDSDLTVCVKNVNSRSDIDFVVITGDVTELGKNKQLLRAKEILKNLKVKYYIIPGNHDTKWSESFCSKFIELWGANRFAFDHKGIRHIGLNSGIIWRGGGGHIEGNDLLWLDSIITATPQEMPVVVYTHHPLTPELDNWFKVVQIVKKRNIRAFLCGHGHVDHAAKVNGIPSIMSRAILGVKRPTGYTLCSVENDTMKFSDVNDDSTFAPWTQVPLKGQYTIAPADSLQFINYTAAIHWTKDVKTTVSAAPVYAEGKVIVATVEGTVYCYDDKGTEIWKFNTGGRICSRPAVQQGIVAVATHEGDLFTLRLETGKVIQSIGLDERITGQLTVFPTTFQEEKTLGLLIGTASGKILCYDMYLLNLIWENTSASAMIETKPLVVKDRILYGCWDGYLYCIDSKTGQMNWKWTDKGSYYFSPASCFPVSDGAAVYVCTPDKYITKIDLLLGSVIWRKNDVEKFEGRGKKGKKKLIEKTAYECWETVGISSDAKKLYVKNMEGHFLILDAANGDILQDFNLGYGLDTIPIELYDIQGEIVFGAKNGTVYDILGDSWSPLLFMGTARILSPVYCGNHRYVVTNMDGVTTCFSPEGTK